MAPGTAEAAAQKSVRTAVIGCIKLAIAVTVLLRLHMSGAISWPALKGLLVSWPVTLAAIALFIVAGLLSAWRLCTLLRPRGHLISFFDSVRLTFMGLFFTVALPGGAGGDAVRIYYATIDNRGARAELATIIFLDRLAGMFAMFLWPVLAAAFFSDLLAEAPVLQNLILAAAAASVAMLAGMLLVMTDAVRHSRILAWAFARPLGRFLKAVVVTLYGYRRHRSALLSAALVSLAIHTLSVAVCLLVAVAVDRDGFSWRMAVLVPLGFLANALPVTPGGLGVGEAALASLFAMAGLRGGPAVMLGWRVIMLLASVSGVFFYLQRKGRMVHGRSKAQYKEQSTYEHHA
jgi:uncharacterized protein (TIRG00374 family)